MGVIVEKRLAPQFLLGVADTYLHHEQKHESQLDHEKNLHTPLLGFSVIHQDYG
jgi:hypothetical protein